MLKLMLAGWMLASGLTLAGADSPSSWQSLSVAQQTILAPVQKEWPTMSALQRRRLLAVATKYPTMKAEQQQRFQKRLIVWSALTPAQRDQARKNYRKLKKLPPNKRQQIKHQLMQEYGKPKTVMAPKHTSLKRTPAPDTSSTMAPNAASPATAASPPNKASGQ